MPNDPESIRARRIVFQYYQLIIAVLFLVGAILDIVIDFKTTPLWVFIMLMLVPLLLMALSRKGFPVRVLLAFNMLFILAINEAQILSNPQSFHVIIYWIGFVPLLVAVLTSFKETVFWTLVLIAFIFANGMYVRSLYPSYEMIVYPHRFMAAGFFFALMTGSIAAFFSFTQAVNHKRLTGQNVELKLLTREIENQNNVLKNQNEEISSINNKLEESNQHLEDRVHERTWALEEQNKMLSEYAFINSHLLRGPLARILGLIHILSSSPLNEKDKETLEHLKTASHELDEVIAKINKALDQGYKFSREEIRKLK